MYNSIELYSKFFKLIVDKFTSKNLNKLTLFKYNRLVVLNTSSIFFSLKRSLNFIELSSNYRCSILFISFLTPKNFFKFCTSLHILNPDNIINGFLTNFRSQALAKAHIRFPSCSILMGVHDIYWIFNEVAKCFIPMICLADTQSQLNYAYSHIFYFNLTSALEEELVQLLYFYFVLKFILLGFKKRILHFGRKMLYKRRTLKNTNVFVSLRNRILYRSFITKRSAFIHRRIFFRRLCFLRRLRNRKHKRKARYLLLNMFGYSAFKRGLFHKLTRFMYNLQATPFGSRFWKWKRVILRRRRMLRLLRKPFFVHLLSNFPIFRKIKKRLSNIRKLYFQRKKLSRYRKKYYLIATSPNLLRSALKKNLFTWFEKSKNPKRWREQQQRRIKRLRRFRWFRDKHDRMLRVKRRRRIKRHALKRFKRFFAKFRRKYYGSLLRGIVRERSKRAKFEKFIIIKSEVIPRFRNGLAFQLRRNKLKSKVSRVEFKKVKPRKIFKRLLKNVKKQQIRKV